MLKFTIIIAILAFADFQTNAATEDSKDQLLLMVLETKNRAFNEAQNIKILAATDVDKFIERVNEMVEKSWYDMEILKKEPGNANDVSCDKMKSNIDNAALKTIAQFKSCIEKVIDAVDTDMNSLASEGSFLVKEIQQAKNVNDELQRKIIDFDAKSYQFAKYVQKLKKCETQSNIVRLNRQISETLTSYKRCLQDK